MKPEIPGFLAPVLPLRQSNVKRVIGTVLAVVSQDQWDQYESGNKHQYAREREIARGAPARDRHHQVFLTAASKPTLAKASKRFIASIRDQYVEQGTPQMMDKRLWVVETIADDTFGILRGAPDPPRVVVMESLEVSEKGKSMDTESNAAVSRWTSALGRVGKALSPFRNYHVDYAVWGGASSLERFHELQPGYLVACEILNANWSNPTSTDNMRKLLLSYAVEVVESGKVVLYQVLQSVDEPTMFKTVEVYSCMDDLRAHMKSRDPEFAEDAMQYRAAVNRVRQLHRCIECLHKVS